MCNTISRQVLCSVEPATISADPLKHCINVIFNCLVGQQPHLLYAALGFWSTLLLQISIYPSCYSEDRFVCIMCCFSFTCTIVTCNHIHVPQYLYTVNVLHLAMITLRQIKYIAKCASIKVWFKWIWIKNWIVSLLNSGKSNVNCKEK